MTHTESDPDILRRGRHCQDVQPSRSRARHHSLDDRDHDAYFRRAWRHRSLRGIPGNSRLRVCGQKYRSGSWCWHFTGFLEWLALLGSSSAPRKFVESADTGILGTFSTSPQPEVNGSRTTSLQYPARPFCTDGWCTTMKRQWTRDELAEHWTLPPDELKLLANKTGATRLGFALLLKALPTRAVSTSHARAIRGR